MKQKWEIIRIIEKGLKGDMELLKNYARKLAEKYKSEGEDDFADCILDAIGDIELPKATQDQNQNQIITQEIIDWINNEAPNYVLDGEFDTKKFISNLSGKIGLYNELTDFEASVKRIITECNDDTLQNQYLSRIHPVSKLLLEKAYEELMSGFNPSQMIENKEDQFFGDEDLLGAYQMGIEDTINIIKSKL